MNRKKETIITGLALIGLFLMYQTALQQPKTLEIKQINKQMVGEKVTVEGRIQNLSNVKDATFFQIKNNSETISAVTFRENLLLYETQKVEASGKVTLHRGELNLQVNKIKTKN